jgi:hypothetical protein
MFVALRNVSAMLHKNFYFAKQWPRPRESKLCVLVATVHQNFSMSSHRVQVLQDLLVKTHLNPIEKDVIQSLLQFYLNKSLNQQGDKSRSKKLINIKTQRMMTIFETEKVMRILNQEILCLEMIAMMRLSKKKMKKMTFREQIIE